MFTRILVPLDGSLRAARSLPVAARLARSGDATVILARIVELPAPFGPDSSLPGDAESAVAEERETVTRNLEAAARSPELAGVRTQVEVAVAAAVAPALLDVIQSARADLVVICSHGHTGFTRWRLGSVAQKIARHATVPALVLRAEGPNLTGDSASAPRTIRALAPLDGSPSAETELEPAAQFVAALAAPGRGALHALHVVQMDDAPQTPDAVSYNQDALRTEAERYLRRVTERFQRAPLADIPLDVTASVVFDADVAAAILDQAASEHHGCDMIAMASHGRSGLQLWGMGSVTERVLQTSDLPLLIVRPQDASLAQQAPETVAEKAIGDEVAGWPGY
jgi:nucleotide-binding universal stress UspA family protein